MKIGVLSDTHGSLFYFEKALECLSDCDVLLHAGDVLYHGPRNDLPKDYNPKGLISKINSLDNINSWSLISDTIKFIIILNLFLYWLNVSSSMIGSCTPS